VPHSPAGSRYRHSYCLAAVRGETLVAYLLAHGWASQSPPPVGTILDSDRQSASEVLFIHDVAVSTAGRGMGLGRKNSSTTPSTSPAATGLPRRS
jgi:hypothetical protein